MDESLEMLEQRCRANSKLLRARNRTYMSCLKTPWRAYLRGVKRIGVARLAQAKVILTLTVFSMLVMGAVTYAQDQAVSGSSERTNGGSYYDRTKAVPQEYSRAQQEADRLVALSADKIVSFLSNEPGLLLECKKLYVRTAYDQGRILSPEDLTDEVIFQLVRDDLNVRTLFTREIEDRYYVRAKPTKEDLQQDWQNGLVPALPANGASTVSVSPASAAAANAATGK